MGKSDSFSGTENVRIFFKEYNKTVDINDWNDKSRLKFSSTFVKLKRPVRLKKN